MDSFIDSLLLRSNRKKSFQAALFSALEDGKLTEQEIAELEKWREELHVSKKAIEEIRLKAYLHAYAKVTADQMVTEDEWDELEQIQDYLNLRDRDIARTKKELYRLRIVGEIKKGNLPLMPSSDILLRAGEVVHWVEPVFAIADNQNRRYGKLVITSKRLVFKSKEHAQMIPLRSIVDIDAKTKSLTIHRNAHKPLSVFYRNGGNELITASILASAIDLL